MYSTAGTGISDLLCMYGILDLDPAVAFLTVPVFRRVLACWFCFCLWSLGVFLALYIQVVIVHALWVGEFLRLFSVPLCLIFSSCKVVFNTQLSLSFSNFCFILTIPKLWTSPSPVRKWKTDQILQLRDCQGSRHFYVLFCFVLQGSGEGLKLRNFIRTG